MKPENLDASDASVVTGTANVKSATSLQRGLEILRAFRGAGVPLGNKEISERTGLPKATVARLVYTLMHMGYLQQSSPTGRYELGEKVRTLGHALLRELPIRRIAHPLMDDFARRHEVFVALGIGEGAHMIYIDVCPHPRIATMRLRVGAMTPMGGTAMGRAYLSALPADQREMHLRRIAAEQSPQQSVPMEQLGHEIERARQEGFAIHLGNEHPQVVAAGVPLWLDRGATRLALNCGVRAQTRSLEEVRQVLGPAMMELATSITTTADRLNARFWND